MRCLWFVLLFPFLVFPQIPQPLWITHVYDITSANQVQDMRANTRQCNMFTFSVTSGTGNWSVQLEYSDSSKSGPWTVFSGSSSVSYTNASAIGAGYGYHPYIRLNTTAGTTAANLSCEKDFLLPTGDTPGGASNSIQYNNGTGFGGILNLGTKGYLYQTGGGAPAFQTVPIPASDIGSPNFIDGTNISITGTWPNLTFSATGGGSGTVTNFTSGNLSPLFTTTVSNPTTTPALTFTLSSASANTVFAGPNGTAGTPSFRALVGADIPAINLGTTGNGGVAALPTFTAGANVSITGTWPNLTFSATGGGSGGWTTGSTPPTGNCVVGDAYFDTTAPANQQLYTCSATDTWIQSMELGNSGGLAVTNGELDLTNIIPQIGLPNEWTALNIFDPGYELKEQPSGSTPATGYDMLYLSSADHLLHMVNSAGTDTVIGSGGGGFTGTAGSVPYVGSGGTLTQQNANLFWDATNHRLGINTNTPGAELEVGDGNGGSANIDVEGTSLPFLSLTNSTTSKKWEAVLNTDQSDALMISPDTHTDGALAVNQSRSVFLGGTITDANAGTGAALAVTPTGITANQPVTVGNLTVNGVCTGCGSGGSGSFYQTVENGGAAVVQEPKLNFISGSTFSVADNATNGSTDVTIPNGSSAGATSLVDSNGNPAMVVAATTNGDPAAPVNYLTLSNAASGFNTELAVTGGDANANLMLKPKGTGTLGLGLDVTVDNSGVMSGVDQLYGRYASLTGTGTANANFDMTTSAANTGFSGFNVYTSSSNTNWIFGTGFYNSTWLYIGDGNHNQSIGGLVVGNTSGDLYLAGNINGTNGSGAREIIKASENGHIYTHGSAPTITGNNCYAGSNAASTTASVTSGSTSITVTDATGIAAGQAIVDAGNADIPAGTTVFSVSGTTITLSAAATTTNASDTVYFIAPTTNNDIDGSIATIGIASCTIDFVDPFTSAPFPQLTATGVTTATPTVTARSAGSVTIDQHFNGPTDVFYHMHATN